MFDLPPEPAFVEEHFTHVPRQYFCFSPSVQLAAIVKIPKTDDNQKPTYDSLTPSELEKREIEDLISSMGQYGKITLLIKHKSRLEKIGDDLRHLHPYKFLSTIFANPQLKIYMKEIMQDYFKRTNFIDGLVPSIEAELVKGTIYEFLSDFCSELSLNENDVRSIIDKKDWTRLVGYLTNH